MNYKEFQRKCNWLDLTNGDLIVLTILTLAFYAVWDIIVWNWLDDLYNIPYAFQRYALVWFGALAGMTLMKYRRYWTNQG